MAVKELLKRINRSDYLNLPKFFKAVKEYLDAGGSADDIRKLARKTHLPFKRASMEFALEEAGVRPKPFKMRY